MSNAIAIAARPAIPVAGAIPAAALAEDGFEDDADSEADAEAEATGLAEETVEAEPNLVDALDSKRDAPLVRVGTTLFNVVVEVK
jgi:hypothetical protein